MASAVTYIRVEPRGNAIIITKPSALEWLWSYRAPYPIDSLAGYPSIGFCRAYALTVEI